MLKTWVRVYWKTDDHSPGHPINGLLTQDKIHSDTEIPPKRWNFNKKKITRARTNKTNKADTYSSIDSKKIIVDFRKPVPTQYNSTIRGEINWQLRGQKYSRRN